MLFRSPTTKTEIDVIVFDKKISIKTLSGINYGGVKLIWTVDRDKSIEFKNNYKPVCDILLVRVNWNSEGGLFLIPQKVQEQVIDFLGIDEYIKLPKQNTNPRGVEISSSALKMLLNNNETKSIPIFWKKEVIQYNTYSKWIELWQQD